MRAIILSGIPGAGKSTWAQSQDWTGPITLVSADQYFIQENGEYRFEPAKLGRAHAACLRKFVEAAQEGARQQKENIANKSILVVDNTNLSSEEIAPYYAVAAAYGYEVELLTFLVEVETALRNVHGVGRASLERMAQKLHQRKIPSFWDIRKKVVTENARLALGQ